VRKCRRSLRPFAQSAQAVTVPLAHTDLLDVEANAIVTDLERQSAAIAAHGDEDVVRLRMLGNVVERFLHRTKDRRAEVFGNRIVGDSEIRMDLDGRVDFAELTAEPAHRRDRAEIIEHRGTQIHRDGTNRLDRLLYARNRGHEERPRCSDVPPMGHLHRTFEGVFDRAQ